MKQDAYIFVTSLVILQSPPFVLKITDKYSLVWQEVAEFTEEIIAS
jgi:hypothetical protein